MSHRTQGQNIMLFGQTYIAGASKMHPHLLFHGGDHLIMPLSGKAPARPVLCYPELTQGGIIDHQTHLFLQTRSEEHTSELQSRGHLVCRLLLEKNNNSGYARWSRTPGTAASGARRSGRRTAATAASHTAQTAARPANVGSSGQHPPSPRSL